MELEYGHVLSKRSSSKHGCSGEHGQFPFRKPSSQHVPSFISLFATCMAWIRTG